MPTVITLNRFLKSAATLFVDEKSWIAIVFHWIHQFFHHNLKYKHMQIDVIQIYIRVNRYIAHAVALARLHSRAYTRAPTLARLHSRAYTRAPTLARLHSPAYTCTLTLARLYARAHAYTPTRG